MSQSPENRQEQFSGTKPVSEKLLFDQKKLEAYMAEHIPDFTSPLHIEQFKGGQSNPTYALTTPNAKYVLRRKPPGKLLPSAHAVEREYKVITSLYQQGFPVPKTYILCEDEEVIGTAFYIMERVEGRIFWEGLLPQSDRQSRSEIYDAMNQTLARLHKMDYQKIGLGDFGKSGNYFARQISRWTKQYQASETEKIKEMDGLIDWLPKHIPDNDETSIVHGDYRLDNMILHPDRKSSHRGFGLGIIHFGSSAWRFHLSFDAMAHATNAWHECRRFCRAGFEIIRHSQRGGLYQNLLCAGWTPID